MKKTQKDAITELYTKYQEEKKLNDTTAKELLDRYQLKISEHEVSKFAVDLPLIKNQLLEKIDEKPELLNLNTLRSLESKQGFKGKDLVEEVKTKEGKVSLQLKATLTEEECEQVIDLYLQTMLQHFTDPKKTDLLKTFESADDLTFALIAGIFVDKENVMDGIEAGVLFPSQFYDIPEARINKNETSNSATSSQSEEIKNTTKNYGNTPAVRNNNPGNIMDTAFGGEKVP